MTDRLLTAKEAGKLYNVPPGWMLAQARADNVPHVRLGRYVRFREADLLAHLEACTHGGTPGWRKHRPTLNGD